MKLSKLILSTLMTAAMMAISPLSTWADDYTIAVLQGDEGVQATEEPVFLFDGDTKTKWCTNHVPVSVIIKVSDKVRIHKYTLIDGEDTEQFYGRHWNEWKIYGANFDSDEAALKAKDTDWTLVDSQEGELYEDKYSTVENHRYLVYAAEAYQYYKICVESAGETVVDYETNETEQGHQQMAEMQFELVPYTTFLLYEDNPLFYAPNDKLDYRIDCSFASERWNTLSLPFSMSADEIKANFGEGTILQKLTDISSEEVTFTTATTVETGEFYIIKPGHNTYVISVKDKENVNNAAFKMHKDFSRGKWSVLGANASMQFTEENCSMVPTYILSYNQFHLVNSNVYLRAFRWYIWDNSGLQSGAKALTLKLDGEETSIDAIDTLAPATQGKYLKDGKLYILKNGQKYNVMGIRE